MIPELGYRLGLPAWAFAGWRGRFFPTDVSPLAGYAKVFNAVEGNTTFYSVPGEKTVRGWKTAVKDQDIEICFKLPSSITHERSLSLQDLRTFFDRVGILEEHLGPFLLQFPARIGPKDLAGLDSLFAGLPQQFRYVLEFRHREFFADQKLLTSVYEQYGFGQVMLDSRALYEGDRQHPDVVNAIHEKPDLPVLWGIKSGLTFLRLVLHPDRLHNHLYVNEWAIYIANRIRDGETPYVMIHCPNNLHCPELALEFHHALMGQPGMQDIQALPSWPVPRQGQLI